MKKIMICLLALLIFSCQKKPKQSEVQSHLKKAMTEFLYQSVNNDSSKVKFRVQEVVFFEDVDFYECEFTVKLQQEGKDTTGMMKARISKDFAKVNRKM